MIHISDFKQLSILLPSTNKALAHVLSQASQEDLQTLSQAKDLRSIMSTILKQSTHNAETNQKLLQLVQKSPTLQNLGDVPTSLKDLLHALQGHRTTQKLQTSLQSFLGNIQDIKTSSLETKFANSGIFLESKLKYAQNPQQELKHTLQELTVNLQASNSPSAKSLLKEIQTLLQTHSFAKLQSPTSLPQNTNSLQKFSDNIVAITQKLSSLLAKSDTLHTPASYKALENIVEFIQVKEKTLQTVSLQSLQGSLQELHTLASKSFTPESKGLVDALVKVLQSLQNIQQHPTQTTLDSLIKSKIPQMLTLIATDSQEVLQKADPLFQKANYTLRDTLQSLQTPQNLQAHTHIKEILSHDLKALLLYASEEVAKTNHPNQVEISRHIDKILLQIDNYQLLSHLSQGTSMYLPFSWDMMQEGEIHIKKSDKEQFYVDINLELKEYGSLKLKLTLFEKDQLKLHIFTSHKDFYQSIDAQLSSLREAFRDIHIYPREVRVHLLTHKDTTKQAYTNEQESLHMGFEVKV